MSEIHNPSNIMNKEMFDALSNDQDAYQFAEYAYARCVEWFGKPVDASWPYHLYSHHRTMCVRVSLLRSYYILLKEEQFHQLNCFNIGHEIYHRVTYRTHVMRHPLWINEMMACMTALELLRQSGNEKYVSSVEEQALDDCPAILNVNVLREFRLPYRRFETFRKNTLYPPTYGADLVKIGSALKTIVGWASLCQLIHKEPIDTWIKSLPFDLQSAACLILDIPLNPNGSIGNSDKTNMSKCDIFIKININYNNGMAYYYKGNFIKAIEIFQELLRQDKENLVVGHALSRALYRIGRSTQSVEELRRLVTIYPNDINLRLSLAIYLYKCEQWSIALTEFERVTQLDPKCATAYYFWGEALKSTGNVAEAKQKWAIALALDDKFITHLVKNVI